MFTLSGQLLGVEQKSGQSADDNGVVKPYSYLQAHILDGMDVRHCRVGDDFGQLPSAGEMITCEVSITPYRRGGDAQVSIRLLRRVDEAGKRAA